MFSQSLKQKLSKSGINYFLILSAFGYAIFLYIFSSLTFPHPGFSPSPDGVANLTLARRIAQGETTLQRIPDVIPKPIRPYFIPRSTVYLEDQHAVGLQSFFGLPVFFSFFIKILPLPAIFVLVSLMGIIGMYWLAKQVFLSERLAFFCTAFFAVHPLFLYYSIQGLMHNLLFVNLIVISLALGLFGVNQKRLWALFFSGCIFGWGIATRTNEGIWLVPLYIGLLAILSQKAFLKNLLISVLGFVLTLLPFVSLSYVLTGSLTQYRDLGETIASHSSESLLQKVSDVVLPAGLDLYSAFATLYHFSLHLWWVTFPFYILIIFLFFFFIFTKRKKSLLVICLFGATFLFLIISYGPSGRAYPPDEVLIGYSHFRYLLPFFLAAPLTVAYCISLLNRVVLQKVIMLFSALVIGISSPLYLIFTETGLQESRYQNILAFERNKKMKETISPQSLLIAGRADKYFFPDWTVAGNSFYKDPKGFSELLSRNKSASDVFLFFIPADINSHKIRQALENQDFQLHYVTMFFEGETLYKLEWPKKTDYE